MGEIINFIPKPDPDREERMTKRAIAEARALYDSIFPNELSELVEEFRIVTKPDAK
jgi:chorismate mutase